jgi:cytoplasmic iron level regulating protein YaaA (DUF328/UPF0246 family)
MKFSHIIGVINIKVIISPAKKMKVNNDDFAHRNMPVFIKESERLLDYLKSLDYKELKTIWKWN